jgi:magnesium-transporting ATPase (P-type)
MIVSISSLNDWIKDKNFVRLQSQLKDEVIAVIRGKHGATQTINIYDLVVGDIVLLETGSRVPADCLLIEGQDVTVDESFYDSEARRATDKEVATEENVLQNPDPFLLSSTLLATGSGKAVVCAVGENSRRGITEEPLDTTSKTPLQIKLQNLGGTFTKWGIIAAVIIFVASLINWFINIFNSTKTTGEKVQNFFEMFTIAITIVMVAVPEGLPLAIVLSLAYSVLRMKNDGLLVKNLNAPEVMGRVDEICTGKTGTLTAGDMKVA